METFPESSFFKERRADYLPTPAAVRAINKATGGVLGTTLHRPPPLKFPSLGLLVKHGTAVGITEARTQIMVREQLRGRVPVPEVFGWAEDGGQGFIYMALIEGATMAERWGGMDEEERLAVCAELRGMAEEWRALKQDGQEPYVGSLGKQPLNDTFLRDRPEFVGPYLGANAVQQLHDTCHIEISGETAIVFTHCDLVGVNILLSPGRNPKVAAVIDWGQSGWYPAYWEYCKARVVDCPAPYDSHFGDVLQEEWRQRYLPLVLDPVDDATHYHPWFYYVLHWGI